MQVAADEEKQRHVEQVDEVLQREVDVAMAQHDQINAEAFARVDPGDVAFLIQSTHQCPEGRGLPCEVASPGRKSHGESPQYSLRTRDRTSTRKSRGPH